MKIEIDTDTDSYAIWKKIEKLVEAAYRELVHSLSIRPGGKESGTTKSRHNIFQYNI